MTEATSKRQWGAAVVDEETGERVRRAYGEIMRELGSAAPPPSTDIEVHVNDDGQISLLTANDAFVLGKGGLGRAGQRSTRGLPPGVVRTGSAIDLGDGIAAVSVKRGRPTCRLRSSSPSSASPHNAPGYALSCYVPASSRSFSLL